MKKVITISRQFGSGGRTVGKRLAEKLGINCYDNEIIEQLAEESGFAKEYVAEQGEYTGKGNWFLNGFNYGRSSTPTNQEYLWKIQSSIIKEIGEREDCVIVGRCADYLLRDIADCLTVFIHSDMDKRIERIVNIYGESNESPEKRLKDKDKRRSSYYQFYTDLQWGDMKNYHIALNSGVLGIDKCVEIIASAYNK